MTDKAQPDVYTPYRERLAELVAERDRINASLVPLQEELNELNRRAEEARLAAERHAIKISNIRGGERYIDLKKEIAALSTLLSGKKPR